MPTLPVVAFVLGGWDFGVAGDLLLQGIIFAQFAHYTTLYAHDILLLRVFVWGLLVLTTLKSAQGLAVLWSQNVRYFLELEAAVDLYQTAWFLEINVSFVAVIAFYVQMFFCHRLWVISSKNIYMVVLTTVLFVVALLAAFVSTRFTIAKDHLQVDNWIAVHLGTVFAGDLLLCSSTTYFLLRHSKDGLPQTAGILNALLKLTIQSAAPAAICAFLGLIASQIPTRTGDLSFWTMLAIMTNSWLPKLYAFSALWTLNSRKGIARSGARMTSSEWHRYTENHLNVGHGIASRLGRSIEVRTPGLHVSPVLGSGTTMGSLQ
ncbi:hypothetical protein MVEN_02174800 [Mycena venus]|uniref:DUF6534 domain-containing protein n=1 Tax=Mycena venus TaxID=2733690 RepID=A0A8H7CH89_9AGAR|nr:hypothetical protein MVEN_02174800 [Mycena venus]